MKDNKFSHKTPHLKGKQHQLDPNLDLKQSIHHATVQYVDWDNDGDVDEYDKKPKLVPDENPNANFATTSKKLIAKQKGEIEHTKRGLAYEETKSGDEGLHDWFGKSKSSDGKKGWVQLGGKWAGKPCARQLGQTSTPKCGSSKMAANLSPEEEEKARTRKNRLDPNQQEKTGGAKPTNVRTEEMDLQEVKDKPGKGSGKKDACYNKVKSRYSVWPSAYASGALVKCRKVGATNWGTKTEETMHEEERYCPLCNKRETRSECSYGEKAWDKVSVKDEEYSMARSELKTIHDALKRLEQKVGKGEGNLEAWVQSKITKAADYIDTAADYVNGGEMNEATRLQAQTGNVIAVTLSWRGKYYSVKIFFPQSKLPTRREISDELQKVYPGSNIVYHSVSELQYGQPLIQSFGPQGGSSPKFGSNKNYIKPMGEEVEVDEDWQKINRKDKTDGLSAAAVKAYRKENPGSKLKTAVTTPPSELKPGSADWKRRKNFCSRSRSWTGERGKAARKRWNCN